MSETLFPLEDYEAEPQSLVKEFIGNRYLLLNALGLEINKFDTHSPYVRLELTPNARFYEPAYGSNGSVTTQWTQRYTDIEDNVIHWKEAPAPKAPEEGFVLCAATPSPEGTPAELLLHLTANVTDIDVGSFAVPLADIQKISLYSDNAAMVKAMQQNAGVDGSTYWYNQMKGFSEVFDTKEIDAFVDMYWPEPTLVFEKHPQ